MSKETARSQKLDTIENSSRIPLSWSALEFDAHPQHGRIVTAFLLVFMAIIVYGIVMNSPIMAITFVLLGLVTYLQTQKTIQTMTYTITHEGIHAGRDFYDFENIRSFWIVYSPEEHAIFFQIKGSLVSSLRIPMGEMSPNVIRNTLLSFVKEEKYEPTVVDTISAFLHI